ncbi:MAG: hypothetical protein ACRDL7_13125, partial [Gaiellaceae bacterium]
HTDNGREFISVAYDPKFEGPRYVKWTKEEKNEIITKMHQFIPGAAMVHGRARHSESQGFIENRNKFIINFLSKFCLKNSTAYYWLGLPCMNYHINASVNSGNGLSPFEYLFGVKPTLGLASLPIADDLRRKIRTEEELNRALDIPPEAMLEYFNQAPETIAGIPTFEYEDEEEWNIDFSPNETAVVITDDRRREMEELRKVKDRTKDAEHIETFWDHLASNQPAYVTIDSLKNAAVDDRFALVDSEQLTGPWRKIVLKKKGNGTWQRFTERGASLDEIQEEGDTGLFNEFGTYIRESVAQSDLTYDSSREMEGSNENGNEEIIEDDNEDVADNVETDEDVNEDVADNVETDDEGNEDVNEDVA